MPLELMYITNNPEVAKIADRNHVDYIFIDMETIGKAERQNGMDTVQSHHTLNDITKIKKVLKYSKLLVRVNPIHENSETEIHKAIKNGADAIMLPFFKTRNEVDLFLKFVNKKAETILLCETSDAVNNIDDILSLEGIDRVHIGLNDLHLQYNKTFMFELVADGTVEMLCKKISEKGIPYGFGGIAKLGFGTVPAENVITEHYHFGSSAAILSRAFCNIEKESIENINRIFDVELKKIREFENKVLYYSKEDLAQHHKQFCKQTEKVVFDMRAK